MIVAISNIDAKDDDDSFPLLYLIMRALTSYSERWDVACAHKNKNVAMDRRGCEGESSLFIWARRWW